MRTISVEYFIFVVSQVVGVSCSLLALVQEIMQLAVKVRIISTTKSRFFILEIIFRLKENYFLMTQSTRFTSIRKPVHFPFTVIKSPFLSLLSGGISFFNTLQLTPPSAVAPRFTET